MFLFLLQRYNKKMKPPNFLEVFLRNNNYFLEFCPCEIDNNISHCLVMPNRRTVKSRSRHTAQKFLPSQYSNRFLLSDVYRNAIKHFITNVSDSILDCCQVIVRISDSNQIFLIFISEFHNALDFFQVMMYFQFWKASCIATICKVVNHHDVLTRNINLMCATTPIC